MPNHANRSPNPDSGETDSVNDADREVDDERTPRWVKVFGIIALALVLIVVGIHLAGGGFHSHPLK